MKTQTEIENMTLDEVLRVKGFSMMWFQTCCQFAINGNPYAKYLIEMVLYAIRKGTVNATDRPEPYAG